MSIVRIEELTKKYNDVPAVDNISLNIERGEIFGLLGPNGAGKTTTINILVGLVKMNKGSVSVLDMDIKKNADKTKMNIGVVPQDIAIYEELTCLENVTFFASLYGITGKELKERAIEALEFTGLSEKHGSFPKEFSGGMKRRLNIACAIAHRPALIIMDEPTVGIDPQSRKHILNSVRKLNDMGCTVIYTSHYMEEVEEVCTRIAIMDHGKVIAVGTKDELVSIISDTNSLWVTLSDLLYKVDEQELKEIAGIMSVDVEKNVVKINTSRDANIMDKIIAYFTSNKISIKNLESKTPDLETVFLTLTGRTLRD